MISKIYRKTLVCTTAAFLVACAPNSETPQVTREPIAYIGHGAFFDGEGNEIEVTPEFISSAQDWYKDRLVERLASEDGEALSEFEARLAKDAERDGIEALLAKQQSLGWIVAHLPDDKRLVRIPGKLRLLERRLHELAADRVSPEILEKYRSGGIEAKPGGLVFLATTNSGQTYINECIAAQVPIPPAINRMAPAFTPGWTSRGFIPRTQQFIVGTPAEVRTYEDGNGMCIALPRYRETDNDANTDETDIVDLDGVICMSRVTSKVCIWDNQMNGNGFSFSDTDQIPIGVADASIDPQMRYQAGGAELEFGSGGICTDCHAGENPYVIHPEASLGGTTDFGDVSQFTPQRYDPIVAGSWPQNEQSQSPATVPAGCKSCHTQGGAGRLPHLYESEDPFDPTDPTNPWDPDGLTGYCNSVLQPAVAGGRATMPQFNGGSMANDADLNTMRAFCGEPRSAGPSDRGDPHLVTTDGTAYDFQAAGEFTALRNSDSGFELQARQTPVTTTFTPGANAYTGLASCVSLNTAVAARLGKRRVSYQSPFGARPRNGEPVAMELRVDGRLFTLPAAGIDLGGGHRIDPLATGDGIRLTDADGTRVAVVPNFWSSQGYWYLDINVGHTPAREGTMGTILPGQWLPLAPDGSVFGPKPAALNDRHDLLNQKFADAWRVSAQSSLFDYAPGTTTATFTDRGWPSAPGGSCTSTTVPDSNVPVKPGKYNFDNAMEICRRVPDTFARTQCAFDLAVMGDESVVRGYMRSVKEQATN